MYSYVAFNRQDLTNFCSFLIENSENRENKIKFSEQDLILGLV